MRRELSVPEYVQGVRSADRAILGRAVTLVESRRREDRDKAQAVLDALLPHTGGAHRVGVSGPPGVGKSTFLEGLGTRLLDAGHRVAVLAVDPTSARTGGSILGDKTRMPRLSTDPRAFVRPSPSTGALGGVHRMTREAMIVVEAAGHDVILVETVGVGQSEIAVAGMVDTMLVLLLAGAGDELQGIKKGILEVADVLAINKADGDAAPRAQRAARELAGALHFVEPATPFWTPEVTTCSGLTGEGLDRVWALVQRHRETLVTHGALAVRRQEQAWAWAWALATDEVRRRFEAAPAVVRLRDEVEDAVRSGRLTAGAAAERLLAAWEGAAD